MNSYIIEIWKLQNRAWVMQGIVNRQALQNNLNTKWVTNTGILYCYDFEWDKEKAVDLKTTW